MRRINLIPGLALALWAQAAAAQDAVIDLVEQTDQGVIAAATNTEVFGGASLIEAARAKLEDATQITAPMTMTVQRGDQSLSMSEVEALEPGDTISVAQKITNTGNSQIAGETFTYDIPESQDFVAGSLVLGSDAKLEAAGTEGEMKEVSPAALSHATRTFKVTLGALAPGQTTEVHYQVKQR